MMGPGIIKQDFEALEHLGYISLIRGTDASGIFETDTKINLKKSKFSPEEVRKSAADWSYLLWDINRDLKSGLMYNTNHDLAMCHVRWGTVGANNDANAHPFLIGDIVGCHNGTLVDEKYRKDAEKTDSEMMFADIAERGIVDVLTGLEPKSAYAISLYNREEKKVYFARNSLRPLHFAINVKRSVLYWASEPWFLYCALARLGIEFKTFSLKADTIVEVSPQSIKAGADKIFHTVYSKENVQKLMDQIANGDIKKGKVTTVNSNDDKKENKKVVEEGKKEEPAVDSSNLRVFSKVKSTTEVREKSTLTKIFDVSGKEDPRVETLFVRCSCGKHRLDALDSYMIKRQSKNDWGNSIKTIGLDYDRSTNTFKCPLVAEEVETQVGNIVQ